MGTYDYGRTILGRIGSATRGGEFAVKKEEPDREKMIAARAMQRAIGRELRRMYDDVVQEPVPDDISRSS